MSHKYVDITTTWKAWLLLVFQATYTDGIGKS